MRNDHEKAIFGLTIAAFVVLAIVALNNATSPEAAWPLAVVVAGGLIAMAIASRGRGSSSGDDRGSGAG